MRRWGKMACTLGLIVALAGCHGAARKIIRIAAFSVLGGVPFSGHPLCANGMPEPAAGWDHGATVLINRDGYVLLHSSSDRVPYWVCEHLDPGDLTGSAKRKDGFKADPLLKKGERAELADYSGSGYDRGHQAPSADYKHSQKEMDESFYLSNMAPQVGEGFNRDIWRVLEERTRDATQEHGDIFIVTGMMVYDEAEEDPATADGFVKYFVIGDDEVTVPTHFYKILIDPQAEGPPETIAFVLENRAYPKKRDDDYDFTPHIKPIRWIEERTGFNFMPSLDDEDARAAEESAGDFREWKALEKG